MNLQIIWYLIAFTATTSAFALPEMAREGQFTCTSCHVSPGGGGTLTSHGRMFAEESLSTWSVDREAEALHGIIRTPEWFLAGGDVRWVESRTKYNGKDTKYFWRMQSDIEAGFHAGPAWFLATWGTKPAGPLDDPKQHDHLVHRGYQARVDLFDEHIVLRGGLFLPKYGLMLSDHTAFIRQVVGLSPDAEQTQIEASFENERFELTLAGLMENDLYDRKGKSKSGYNVGASMFLAKKHRVNTNILSTKLVRTGAETQMTANGISGVITLNRKLYAMAEIDRVANSTKTSSSTIESIALANFLSLNVEAYRGIYPFFRYEYLDSDLNKRDTSTTRWGPGLTLYPRPHLQVEGRALRTVLAASRTTRDQAEAIMHYYF